MTTEHELLVTHALRLKGFADTPDVAAAAGLSIDETHAALTRLADAEHAIFREGRMTGWMLKPEGRAHGEALLAAQLDASGRRADLDAAYRRFLDHNQPFLALCTEWQTRMVDGAQVVNDHTDQAYDDEVIGRLGDIDAQMQPICADLEAILDRFGGYGQRFTHALQMVQAGETEWFAKPVIESYHTVWFELHEDLLASLGIDRAKEGHA